MPLLCETIAGQTATRYDLSSLAGPLEVSRPTTERYVDFMERLYLVEFLPPWFHNRLKRLTKSPKLHFTDTGLLCRLLGVDATALMRNRALLGQVLETFVLQERSKLAQLHERKLRFFHFRDRDQNEVDIVVERPDGLVAGVEVKNKRLVTAKDFRGLRKMAEALGDQFACGVILCNVDRVHSRGDRVFVVPLHHLWTAT